jgi:hypothetical protein
MWWIGFEEGDRIPVLTYVNVAIHEVGHLLSYPLSDLATMFAGSIAQVAVPVALALYFLVLRDDWTAAALCVAWAATSSLEVAIYIADAPRQELELIGGTHDWAYILGPDGYEAMDRAGPLADSVREGAWAGLATAIALCVVSGMRGRPRTGATATSPAGAQRSPERARGAVPNA